MTKTKKKPIQSPPTEEEQMKNSKPAVKEETSIEKNITISKNRSKPKENKQNQNRNPDETNTLITNKQKPIRKNDPYHKQIRGIKKQRKKRQIGIKISDF